MTQDLTKINSPWGLLDAETKKALKEAERKGKVVQRFSDAGWADHTTTHPPCWYDSVTYRLKHEAEVVRRWVNVYFSGCSVSHKSREWADKNRFPDRICVLRIEWHDGVPSFHREEN